MSKIQLKAPFVTEMWQAAYTNDLCWGEEYGTGNRRLISLIELKEIIKGYETYYSEEVPQVSSAKGIHLDKSLGDYLIFYHNIKTIKFENISTKIVMVKE